MQKDFYNRGYLMGLIRDAAKEAAKLERRELLQYKKSDDATYKGITAAFDFTPLAAQIKKMVARHWHLVRDLWNA